MKVKITDIFEFEKEYHEIPEDIRTKMIEENQIYYFDTKKEEYVHDTDEENQIKLKNEKDEKIKNLEKEIYDLKKVNQEQNIVLNTYIVKLVQNSTSFTNAEKESLWLLVDGFDNATIKEIELNELMYPDEDDLSEWNTGMDYVIGDKFVYENKIYKVVQNHKSQSDWLPCNVPALYVVVGRKEQATEIKDWKQPVGSHDAYNINDLVRFDGKTHKSLINGNVWSPTAYPAGWEKK